MINASTFEKLKALNLSAMADEFQNQIDDSKAYNSLGFEERIGLLVDAEWNRRQANKLKNLIKELPFLFLRHASRTSSICRTENLTRHRCSDFQPASISMKGIISS